MSGCFEERPAGGSTDSNSVREEQWHTVVKKTLNLVCDVFNVDDV